MAGADPAHFDAVPRDPRVATSTAESGAGWNTFFKDLVARGLNEIALVTSDAHAGLVDAIGAALPGASWQRCRTHHTANSPVAFRQSGEASHRWKRG